MQPDPRIEAKFHVVLSAVLRTGVTIAACTIAAGGAVYLYRRFGTPVDYQLFNGEPVDLRTVRGIVIDARSGSGRGLIQLGLLFLMATPVARVVASVGGFAIERDWRYVGITLFVLILLAWSLFG